MLRVFAFALSLFAPLALLLPAPAARADAPSLYVFAAASLTDALSAVGEAYGAQEDGDLRLVFESSSTLARQIENGAPADLYLSANPSWMDYAQARGLIATATRRDLLANGLVLIAPQGRAPTGDILAGPDALLSALGARGRLALGDPDHVPAGIYGRAALESLGLWAAVAPRVARAANVRAALALVSRAEAPLGLVYRTDALIDPGVEPAAEIPASAHPPIRYPVAVTAAAAADPDRGRAAERFLRYLAGGEAGAIFRRFGFAAPPPPSAPLEDGASG